MAKIKIKILKDFTASPNGIHSESYKRGEILEIGTPKLPMGMYEWFNRNVGFGELYLETQAIAAAPENKVLEAKEIINEADSSPEPEKEITIKNNPKKRK